MNNLKDIMVAASTPTSLLVAEKLWGAVKIAVTELNDIEKEKLKEFDIIVGNFVFSPKENNVNGYPPASYDYISWLDKYNEISEVPLFFNKFKDASFNNLILENKLEFIISFVKNNLVIFNGKFISFRSSIPFLSEYPSNDVT